ncbi:MAG TPA: glycosyltransferase, partial [Bacteroidia bacterium]|nr:glycosyltransferase [Bacteroidia bacterium]
FEYGASHMAVVAPNTPTIKELFSDKEIYFFENGSQDELYAALKEACINLELSQQLAENLYQKIIINYSKNNTFEFYNELIMQAAK